MKHPITKQHDQKDCGAACLSMIARFYGLNMPIVKYRELIKVDNDGSNLYAITQGASQIGLSANALEGTYNELEKEISSNKIHFPFIARIISEEMFEHYIVVYNITSKKVIAGDPAKGKVTYSIELFKKIWTGHIVTFEKTPRFKKGNEAKGSLKKFVKLVTAQKKLITIVVILSFLISAISLFGSMLFEYITNNVLYPNNPVKGTQILSLLFSNIDNLCTTIIIFYIFQGFTQVLRCYLLAIISKRVDITLNMTFFKHLIHLPINFFTTRKSGEIMSRFSDTSNIREAVSSTVLTLIVDSIMTIFFGCYLCYINVFLFFIALSMMICYAIIVYVFKNPIKQINQTSMEENAQMTSYLKESIDGMETIKSFRNEDIVYNKTCNIFTKMINVFVKGSVVYALKDAIIATIASVGVVALLWVGNELCINGTITLGSMISFYVVLNYFLSPLKNLVELQSSIQAAVVASERLNDILEIPVESKNIFYQEKANLKGDISFNNITFRYGYREAVINDLSINIKQGYKVAIVGESGSGKTTLMKLLMAFYRPESGTITINEHELCEFSPNAIRDKISYVSQNVFFFSDTIKNNLTMNNPNISENDVNKACSLAMAKSFIEELPLGYDTILSENASNLSGGQRQRLAIARALLQKPDILILDEATSSLDAITEESIKTTIFKITNGITTFIIAHRLSTIKNCDLILVMDNGKIVESGTHNELIALDGIYKSYWDSNL